MSEHKCKVCGYESSEDKWNVIEVISTNGYVGLSLRRYIPERGKQVPIGGAKLLGCPECGIVYCPKQ